MLLDGFSLFAIAGVAVALTIVFMGMKLAPELTIAFLTALGAIGTWICAWIAWQMWK